MAGHVWVICKLPHGIHLDKPNVKSNGVNATGDRDLEARVTLKGQNARQQETGLVIPHDQRPGVTRVDKDFWEAWLAEHKDFPAVKNELIYAVDKDPDRDQGVQREMDDLAKEKNGFEPVEQDKPAPGVEELDRKG